MEINWLTLSTRTSKEIAQHYFHRSHSSHLQHLVSTNLRLLIEKEYLNFQPDWFRVEQGWHKGCEDNKRNQVQTTLQHCPQPEYAPARGNFIDCSNYHMLWNGYSISACCPYYSSTSDISSSNRAINIFVTHYQSSSLCTSLDTVANTQEEHVCIQITLMNNLEIKFMCWYNLW